MTFRETIRFGKVPTIPRLPPIRVAEQVEHLTQRFEPVPILTKMDAHELVGRLHAHANEASWEKISFRDWKKAAWVLFSHETPLASHAVLFERLFGEYRNRNKRSAYQGLILAYLRDFDPQSQEIRRTGREIDQVVHRFTWPWKARAEKYQLFSETAPQALAAACLASDAPDEVLQDAGMGGARSTGGFAASAYSQALRLLRDMLSRSEPNFSLLDRVISWSVSKDGLKYPGHRAQLAEALLLPWSNKPLPDVERDKISSFLLGHFHDPRLPRSAKNWIGVDDNAIAVLRKWLTGAALEQFFTVVDQVANETMWKYRRAFWLAYHKQGVIKDAWVLFGPEAQRYATRVFGKTETYGLLEKGGILPSHSVLLMRIDRLVIADWSHSGKCNIWRDGNERAPKLYLGRYSRDQLVLNSDNNGQVHYSSDRGTWQREVAKYIRMHTNISVSDDDYMPNYRGY